MGRTRGAEGARPEQGALNLIGVLGLREVTGRGGFRGIV
ncbi:helix-turn-helix domain-containing protein [Mesorhizobium prunaredense]